MKRKKWSEQEEQSLISKYSDLQTTGGLSKLKTREKKFRPVADHVNASHHSSDPAAFPFRWSWRDVSIKVQNMRHQYLCVKQKIRLADADGGGFNWADGDNHWQNFLSYKSVFGDIDLDSRPKRPAEEEDNNIATVSPSSSSSSSSSSSEEDSDEISSEEEAAEEERGRRRREEERREEEEMEWRERMLALQLRHEKEMVRMQADAFQAQTQVLGAMVRLVCQFFGGGGSDGMGGVLANQVLGNLEHHHHHNHHHHNTGGGGGGRGGPELGDNGKPDSNSPSGFM